MAYMPWFLTTFICYEGSGETRINYRHFLLKDSFANVSYYQPHYPSPLILYECIIIEIYR